MQIDDRNDCASRLARRWRWCGSYPGARCKFGAPSLLRRAWIGQAAGPGRLTMGLSPSNITALALDWRSRSALSALLFGAFCLHNAEEALTFARYRQESEVAARKLLDGGVTFPDAATFQVALLSVTIAIAACLLWVATGPTRPLKWRLLRLLATLLLVNVFVPHIPAAIALGGYTPGLLSAMFVNLPLAIVVLRMSASK